MKTIIRFITFIFLAAVFTYCSNSKPKKSIENLKTAFNNESTSSEKYSKFAQTALTEGFDTLAKLFDAASKSENIHALNHAKALEKFGLTAGIPEISSFEVKTTVENLQVAINAETYEMQTLYPGFIRIAEEEKAPEAAKSFTWAQGAEIKHLGYYRQAAASLASGNESALPDSWLVCPVCGNTFNPANVKPNCEFCLTKQENFIGYTEVSK
jgi:rubrerythrin